MACNSTATLLGHFCLGVMTAYNACTGGKRSLKKEVFHLSGGLCLFAHNFVVRRVNGILVPPNWLRGQEAALMRLAFNNVAICYTNNLQVLDLMLSMF